MCAIKEARTFSLCPQVCEMAIHNFMPRFSSSSEQDGLEYSLHSEFVIPKPHLKLFWECDSLHGTQGEEEHTGSQKQREVCQHSSLWLASSVYLDRCSLRSSIL